jgi:hypothetical protein
VADDSGGSGLSSGAAMVTVLFTALLPGLTGLPITFIRTLRHRPRSDAPGRWITTEAQTVPTLLKVVRAVFDSLSKEDLATLSELHPNETVDDFVAIGETRGTSDIRRSFDELFAAFPDVEVTEIAKSRRHRPRMPARCR